MTSPSQQSKSNQTQKCRVCKATVSKRNIRKHMSKHTVKQPTTPRNLVFAPTNTLGRPRNSAASSLRKGLAQKVHAMLGSGKEGHEWALRALHPCDDTASGGMKIPDNVYDQSISAEHRGYEIIKAPASATESWDYQLLILPLPDLPLVYRTRVNGANWSYWHSITINTVNAGVNVMGRVNADPNLSVAPEITTRPALQDQYTQFRQSFRGITIHQNANSLTNQGYVVSGQWGSKPVRMSKAPWIGVPPDVADSQFTAEQPFLHFTDIPNEPSDVISKLGGAGEWESRKGVYMPMRFEDPVHQYTACDGWDLVTGNNDDNGNRGGFPVVLTNTGTLDHEPFSHGLVYTPGSNADSRVASVFTSAGAINQLVGVVFFTGLDPKASLVVKLRSGLEGVPTSQSPTAPFVTRAAEEDDVASKVVQRIYEQIPMSYEARYNSLGLLAPLIWQAAKFLIPKFMPWIESKLAPKMATNEVTRL